MMTDNLPQSVTKQIGGTHYVSMKYQPICFAIDMNLDGVQLLILKYVSRFRNKNGKIDLEKAIHCCELAIELNDIPFYKRKIFVDNIPFYRKYRLKKQDKIIKDKSREFVRLNEMTDNSGFLEKAIYYLSIGYYDDCMYCIKHLKNEI